MGLEVSNFISQLVAAWPLSTDKVREGDDHFRNLKQALLNTFPNMNGQVTATPAQLNSLPSSVNAVVAELLKHIVPVGAITAWSGAIGAIPAGWALCDGGNGTPDLRGRFILAAGGVYPVGAQGGAETVGTGGSAIGAVSITETVLSEAQIPTHFHYTLINSVSSGLLTSANSAFKGSASGGDSEYDMDGGPGVPSVGRSSTVGASQGHTHGIQGDSTHAHATSTMSPYYALAYIMKVSAYAPPP